MKSQLEPLAVALADAAERDAEARLAEARAHAQTIQDEAASEVRDVLSKAEAEGVAAAERESSHRLVAAKRRARRGVLAAQRATFDALFDTALAAIDSARGGQQYGSLQERLARTALETLGHEATVESDPDGRGGVLARADGRSIDLTLPVLVRRCISRMGKDVSKLWS